MARLLAGTVLSGRAGRIGATAYLLALTGYAAQAAGIGGAGMRSVFEPWVYLGVVACAAGLCLARAALVRQERLAWCVIGAGVAAWLGGEIYWSVMLEGLAHPPVPSPADAGYLAFYPACYVGIGLLMRARLLSRDPGEQQHSLWLDGIVGALATAAVAVAVLYAPILQSTGGSAADVATNLAYPLGDLLLLGIIVSIFALTGWRPGRAWGALALALAATALCDGAYLYESALGSYKEGGLLDVGWLVSISLIAVAAWLAPEPVRRQRLEGIRALVAPSVFGATAIALLIVDAASSIPRLSAGLAIAALVAMFVRAMLTLAENQALFARVRREAMTDPLTAIGNRRRLMRDLQTCTDAAGPDDGWYLAFFDLNGFKRYNDTFGHQAGDALLARLGASLESAVRRSGGTAYRLGGDEFCALMPSELLEPARVLSELGAALSESGASFEITSASGIVQIPAEASRPDYALQLADERMYTAKHGRGTSAAGQTRDALMQALQEREPELGDHVRRVAHLAIAVGRELKMDVEQLDELNRAAELHDIGKMAIPDAVLHKPGPLDDEEWRLMHQHTIIGERILNSVPALAPVARIVRSSHEHWNGSGYPDSLRGAEIPLGSRIVQVCDAFSAMTTTRSYRAAMSDDDAAAELVRCSAEQFDPTVVELFLQQLRRAVGDGAGLGAQPMSTGVPIGTRA